MFCEVVRLAGVDRDHTYGAPPEASAANLAIETFLPMDERSAVRLRELSDNGGGE